jgi:hypothetical protein
MNKKESTSFDIKGKIVLSLIHCRRPKNKRTKERRLYSYHAKKKNINNNDTHTTHESSYHTVQYN